MKKKLDLDSVLTKIVALLLRHPPTSLSFSKISRLVGVPRPTLYYYFGNSLDRMIEESVRYGMKNFVQLVSLDKVRQSASWETFQKARFRVSFGMIRRFPWGPELYFRFRNQDGPLGAEIRGVEEAYLQKLSRVWERHHGGKPDPRALRLSGAIRLGIAWALAADRDFWFNPKNKGSLKTLQDLATEISTLTTKTRFTPRGGSPKR